MKCNHELCLERRTIGDADVLEQFLGQGQLDEMYNALLLCVGERQHGHHERTSRQTHTTGKCMLVAWWIQGEHRATLASSPRGHVAGPLAALAAVVTRAAVMVETSVQYEINGGTCIKLRGRVSNLTPRKLEEVELVSEGQRRRDTSGRECCCVQLMGVKLASSVETQAALLVAAAQYNHARHLVAVL